VLEKTKEIEDCVRKAAEIAFQGQQGEALSSSAMTISFTNITVIIGAFVAPLMFSLRFRRN
jgi:hypothetical protein